MTILAPLMGIFAVSALVILVLHMYRRKDILVPSIAIWKLVATGSPRQSRSLHFPKPSWPLFLQLIAALSLVGALMQFAIAPKTPVDHFVYALDISGDMATQVSGVSRVDLAKAQISDHLSDAYGDAKVSLVTIGQNAVPVAVRQQENDRNFDAALAAIKHEDGPARWDDLAAIANEISKQDQNTILVVYSDRAPLIEGLNQNIEVRNALIGPMVPKAELDIQLRPFERDKNKYTVKGEAIMQGFANGELSVRYTSPKTSAPLEIVKRNVGQIEVSATVTPDQITKRPLGFDFVLPDVGIVSFGFTSDLGVKTPENYFIIGDIRDEIKVLYIGEGGQPLLNAIRAVDGVVLYQAQSLPENVSEYALVVVDNYSVSRQPETNTLWVGSAGIIGDAPAVPLEDTRPSFGNTSDPLMRDFAWQYLTVEAANKLQLPDAAKILLSAQNEALIAVSSHKAGENIFIGFDPRVSNWASQKSMPAFVGSLMSQLGVQKQGIVATPCLVGQVCSVDARLIGGTFQRIDSSGAPLAGFAPEALNEAAFNPIHAGLYQIAKGDLTQRLAVNVAPYLEKQINAEDVAAFEEAYPTKLWPYFIALAIIALIIEAIIAGRGREQYLHLRKLLGSSTGHNRRRILLGLRVLTLVAAVGALLGWAMPAYVNKNMRIVVIGADGAIEGYAMPKLFAPVLIDTLSIAAAEIPQNQNGEIVLSGHFSDETQGLSAFIEKLRKRNITVSALNAKPNAADAIAVTALSLNDPIYVGDTVPVVANIWSDAEREVDISFKRNDDILLEQNAALKAGDNRIEFLWPDAQGDAARFELAVKFDDAIAENNALSVWVSSREVSKVAIVSEDPESAAVFAEILSKQDIVGEYVPTGKVPYRLDGWRDYDAAILLDVPSIALASVQQNILTDAVAQYGMGLMILGGRNSYGPGGYLETPLEEVSPISSRVPREAPTATLVFVLDRSGSMQQPVGTSNRLDIAKQATAAAVKLLNPESNVGIVVFDSEATIVLPVQRVGDGAAVDAALASVDSGGGTALFPGLKSGYEMLRDFESAARHIIVMTDGLSQPADYGPLMESVRASGITVSAVSIGKGAERELIQNIARLGGGAFHATDDFAALPSILSQEAQLLSGTPIEEHIAQPLWASRDAAFLKGLPATLPQISGFVLTTVKPEAQLSIVVPDSKGEPMPLLASWKYGNGQVLAFTSDATGSWTRNWQDMDVYSQFYGQIIRQFLPAIDRSPLQIRIFREGDRLSTQVFADAAGGVPEVRIQDPSGEERLLTLNRISAGEYTANLMPDELGKYVFVATQGDALAERAYDVSYSNAYSRNNSQAGLMRVVGQSGGAFVSELNELPQVEKMIMWVSNWQAWAILSLALLLIELTLRYTSILNGVVRRMRARG